MKVTVRWFAVLRERRGVEREGVDVEEGVTVAQLYARFFPGPGAVPVGYARNAAWARPDEVVREGDEVAFLPPLGGG